MAAIDKLFGTIEEYDEFYAWCEKNIPLALKNFTPRQYKIDHNHSMTLFPSSIDMVLLEYCPLKFITDQIKEAYDLTNDDLNVEIPIDIHYFVGKKQKTERS